MKCGPNIGEDPFARVKDSITDPETQVATHSSKLETAISTSSVTDGEVAKLHADLGALSAQLIMDAMRVDERKIPATTAETLQLQSNDRVVVVPGVFQRRVPTIQRVEKAVELPQVQYNEKVINVPVVIQRPVLTAQTVQQTVEGTQAQHIENIVNVPVMSQRQALTIQTETVEVFRNQFLHHVVDVPVVTKQEHDLVSHRSRSCKKCCCPLPFHTCRKQSTCPMSTTQ